MMNVAEQASAIVLLIDFLFGIACGVVGGASRGSRHEDRERTLFRPAPSVFSEGARVLHRLETRDDDGYLQSLLRRPAAAPAKARVADYAEPPGQGPDQ
jgi:hypothetical protein